MSGLEQPATLGPVMSVVRDASEITGMTIGAITGSSRAQSIVRVRYACMWAAFQALGLSYVRIGRPLGISDHTSVIAGLRRAQLLRDDDPDFARLSDDLFTRARARSNAMMEKNDA